MAPTTPETAPGFWRCGRCGTPNPRAAYLTRCIGCGRPVPPESLVAPEPPPPTKHQAPKGRARRTSIASGLYAALILAAIGMIRGLSLGWWPVMALVFLPRGLFLLPIVPLAIGAFRSGQRWAWALVVIDAGLVIGPLMGFSVPIGRANSDGPRVRIMTFNQGGGRFDEDRLIRYLDRQQVDVVCFQEPGPSRRVDELLVEKGWHLDQAGRVASRFPIASDLGRSVDVNKSGSRFTMTLFRVRLRHPDGFEFEVGSAHLPTVRRGLTRLFAGDLPGFREHLAWWDEEAARLLETLHRSGETPILVGGDFNMPGDYRTMGSIRSSYPSAFERAGWGFGHTRPTAWPWVRIDHVLGGRDWQFSRCWVGPDFGSDHLPLVADAVFGGPIPEK